MERRRRTKLQRLALPLLVSFCTAGCALGVPPVPQAEFKGEPLTPNEEYHAVGPCAEHILAPARVLIEVAVDADGEPQLARVTSIGGTVRQAFVDCTRTQMLAQEYAPRGKAVTLGAVVDLRVGAYSTAGNPTPIPPYY